MTYLSIDIIPIRKKIFGEIYTALDVVIAMYQWNMPWPKLSEIGGNIWSKKHEKRISKISWGNGFTKYEVLHGRKNAIVPVSEITTNHNDVTFQYDNKNVSLNKLFCMHTNADCLRNKVNELTSVIDSCDTHPHFIGVCDIKPKYFTLHRLPRILYTWLFFFPI